MGSWVPGSNGSTATICSRGTRRLPTVTVTFMDISFFLLLMPVPYTLTWRQCTSFVQNTFQEDAWVNSRYQNSSRTAFAKRRRKLNNERFPARWNTCFIKRVIRRPLLRYSKQYTVFAS